MKSLSLLNQQAIFVRPHLPSAKGCVLAVLLAFLSTLPALRSPAAPGDLDPTFGIGGIATTDFHGLFDTADSMAIDSSGRIVLAGSARTSVDEASSDFALARFTSAGVLDPSFGSGGKVTTDFSGWRDEGIEVAIDSSGRILLAGMTFSGSSYDFAVARYTSSGALDASFGSGGKVVIDLTGAFDVANDVAVDSSGRILLGGAAGGDFAVVRLTSSGALDSSFGTGGVVSTDFSGGADTGFDLALDASGRILLGGQAAVGGGGGQLGVIRYTASGALDSTFGSGGKAMAGIPVITRAAMLAVDGSGRIVAVGSVAGDIALTRFTSGGLPDPGFGPAMTSGVINTDFHGNEDSGSAIAIDSAGLILVSGWAQTGTSDTSANFALARYTTTGALDTTFGSAGKVTTDFNGGADYAAAVAVDSNGRTVVAGRVTYSATGADFGVARYLAAGPEISLKFDGNTVSSGGSHPFAATNLGAETSVTVTITNDGSAPITGISTSITPSNADYRIGAAPPPSVADGATGTFTVIFDPQLLGTRTGTLQVTSNAAPSPYLVQLSGTGIDTIAPVVNPQASNLSVVAGSPNFSTVVNTWLQSHGGAAATDNSGSVSWSHNYVTPPLPGSSATITFTAADPSNNQATTSALLIIIDQTPPVISPQAANLTIVDGVAGNATTISNWLASRGGANATDNSGSFTWSHDYSGAPPTPGTSATITFTATDGSNNASATTAQLIVLDQTPPVITGAAAPLTVECDAPDRIAMVDAWLAAQGTASATDNSGSFTWSHNYTTLPGACGLVTVTFFATDPSGNVATTAAALQVSDGTDPVISTPATGLTVESDGLGNVAQRNAWLASRGGAAATDNCGPLTWSHDFTGLANTLPQTVPVTFSASDGCGNAATTVADFVIQDTTPPSITVAATDYYGDCDEAAADMADFLATRGGAQAVDIAGPVTWSHNYSGTLPDCKGYVTVTFTATDTVGLAASTSARFFLFPPGAVWIGPAAGSWNTGASWRQVVPTAALDAYVDLFDFRDTRVTVPTGNWPVKNLYVGAGDEVTVGVGSGIASLVPNGNLIRNDGTLRLFTPASGTSAVSSLYVKGATTIEGTGRLVLDGAGRNCIDRSNNSTSDILTVAAGQEITTTANTLDDYQKTAIWAGLINYGTVTADGGGLNFYLNPKTNHGVMRAIHGGVLRMQAPVSNLGTLSADAGSTLWLQGSLAGGELSGSGRLLVNSSTSITGPVSIANGFTAALESAITTVTGSLTNHGTIQLGTPAGTGQAILYINGAVTLAGTGKFRMQGAAARRIDRANGSTNDILTVAAGQEITTTADTVADYQKTAIWAGLVNHGTVTADGGGLTFYFNPKTNHGLIRSINGGSLVIEGPLLTNYNAATDTLAGGRYEVTANGSPTILDMRTCPIVTIAANTHVCLSGAGASLPQLSTLANVQGTLCLAQGKTLTTSGNLTVTGRLEFGLGDGSTNGFDAQRLVINGDANLGGAVIDVRNLGAVPGIYQVATWTGNLTGSPVLGTVPGDFNYSLILDPVAKTLSVSVANDNFRILGLQRNAATGVNTITYLSVPGVTHTVRGTADFIHFDDLPATAAGTGGVMQYIHQSPAIHSRYFYQFSEE